MPMSHKKPFLVLFLTALLLMPSIATAHPLGNFTTNVHLGLLVTPGELKVTVVVDMAEIPAFREKRVLDRSGDEIVSETEREDYVAAACLSLQPQVGLSVDGEPLRLSGGEGSVSFPPGQGGLDTLRLECEFETALAVDSGELTIANNVHADRLGWSEIIVQSDGLAVDTELPSESPSEVLTAYPSGPTENEREGVVVFSPGSGTGEAASGGTADIRPTLVERIGRGVVGRSGVVALLAALALGTGHALAPGHGKTLMAAYLVGQRGSPRTAIGLGLSVALSHTIGVAILGLITALTTSAFRPESVYPWLSLVSALIVTSIGAVMLFRALGKRASTHTHDHDHDHDHHHHDSHDRYHHHEKTGGWRSLAALGLAGGLVPSASAVVLLLGAVAQGEAWWGLILVAAFGLGMSASLIGAGLLAVGAQRWGWTRIRSDRWRSAWQRRVPLIGGMAVTLIGFWLLWDTSRRFFA
ncbi:MAG: nickel/cobalt transporter [Acidimicrobiia bacterium]